MTETILLTGASGFLGGHTALALLDAGYHVRGSVRSAAKGEALRTMLASAGADTSGFELVSLDLEKDAGWAEAIRGVQHLIHTASPFEQTMPRDKATFIRPAVGGTTRAIRAALAGGVKRIVHTSSTVAIAYGHGRNRTAPYTAADWTDVNGRGITAYSESKTLAEKEAWRLMREAGRESDLTVINPSGMLGPLLDDDPGTSSVLIARLIDGKLTAMPRVPLPLIDVRDVAAAHVAALQSSDAGGRRYLMVEKVVYFRDLARALREALPERATKVPQREMPDWLLKLIALFNKDMRLLADEISPVKQFDSAPVRHLLARPLIPIEDAAVAMARSLIEQGIA